MSDYKVAANFAFGARNWLGRHRALFPMLRMYPRIGERVVSGRTEVCIEGFPRSGNSFATRAFMLRNPDRVVAHHVHVPMQVLRAVALDIPCAVLFRQPTEAVASLIVMSEEELSARLALRSYIGFYGRLLKVRDRVATCSFDDLLDDPSVIARRLNHRYGTEFDGRALSAAEKDEVLDDAAAAALRRGMSSLAWTVPRAERRDRNREVARRLRDEPLLEQADRVHRAFLGKAGP